MTELFNQWRELDPRKQLVAVLSALAILVTFVWIIRLATAPSMGLLYAGLDPQAASEITTALEQSDVPFELRNGGIYVEENQRDQARMSLAAQNLPASGLAGYELLDTLSGFGTTSQMFDAAYWRATEGELARTILASNNVRAARVHIARPPQTAFAREIAPTASVIVTMSSGTLSQRQAQAIRHLVASAVNGLTPDGVSVIDAQGGVILEAGSADDLLASSDAPGARSATLKANVERLLAARVGPGRAIVEVTVDADMDAETITERVIDPESRVAIHSDTEESTESSTGGATGVTVASNLPDGDAGGDGGGSSQQSAQSRERINYEVSEILRERVRAPGQIRRVSVAVLVDGVRIPGESGALEWQPRPEEELNALRELVQSAVGYDAARGDVVTIESLEFPQVTAEGTLAEASFLQQLGISVGSLLQLAVLGLVALLLGLFVLRPLFARPEDEPNLIQIQDPPLLQDVENVAQTLEDNGDSVVPPDREGPLRELRETLDARKEEASAILRSWIEAPEDEPQESNT